jgi:hypothetical protein
MGQKAGSFLSEAVRKQDIEEKMSAVAKGIEAWDPATLSAVETIAGGMAVSLSYLEQLLDPEVDAWGDHPVLLHRRRLDRSSR